MFKKNVYLLIAILFLTSPINVLCAEDDDFFVDDDIDLGMLEAWEKDHVGKRIGGFPPGTIRLIAGNLQDLIKEPLWCNTRSPRGRNTVYLFPNHVVIPETSTLNVSMFFNKTNNLQASILDFLNLSIDQKEITDVIEEILLGFPSISACTTAQELSSLLPLFTKISIQERKTGLFLNKCWAWKRFEGELITSPFTFAERNFWLNLKDQAIFNEIGNRIFPGRTVDENQFVRMRFGLGDTCLKFGIRTIDYENLTSIIGTSLLLPTGTIGHKTRLTPINIHSEQLTELSYAALKNIRDHFLDAQLGSAGHFALGIYSKSKINLFRDLADFCLQLSYDKYFPGPEDRLFMYKKTMEPSDLDTSSDEAAFESLKVFLPQYLIPLPFKATVQPGDVFNATAAINFGVKRWNWIWGYNYYHQQRELITKVHNTNDTAKLRIIDAAFGDTSQHKIFWDTTYTKALKRTDLLLEWGSNITVRSDKLGHDWTSYFKIGANI